MLLHRVLFRLAVSGLCHFPAIFVSIFGIHFQPSSLSLPSPLPCSFVLHASPATYRWHQQPCQRCVNAIRHHITPRRWHQRWNSTCAFIIANGAHTNTSTCVRERPAEKATSKRCRLGLRKTKPLKKLIKFLLNLCASQPHRELHRRHRNHQKWESGAAQNRNERTNDRPKTEKEEKKSWITFFSSTSLPYSGRTGAHIASPPFRLRQIVWNVLRVFIYFFSRSFSHAVDAFSS